MAAGTALSLRLEENTFPRYQATLRESAARQTVWRSGSIAAIRKRE